MRLVPRFLMIRVQYNSNGIYRATPLTKGYARLLRTSVIARCASSIAASVCGLAEVV